jgi:hypothetical protein
MRSAPCHLDGGAPRKRHQKNAAGIDAAGGQMHHAVGQRAGLARSRPRDHQQGWRGLGRRRANAVLADAVLDGAALVGVELVEIGRHWRQANRFAGGKARRTMFGLRSQQRQPWQPNSV